MNSYHPQIIFILNNQISLINPIIIDNILETTNYQIKKIYKDSLEEIIFGLKQEGSCALLIDSLIEPHHLNKICQSKYYLEIGWYYKNSNSNIKWVLENLK